MKLTVLVDNNTMIKMHGMVSEVIDKGRGQ